MTITNLSASAIENWQVQWTATYTVSGVWSCELDGQSDGYVTVSHPDWSSVIEPGQSVTFGFQGEGVASPPVNVLVNGSSAESEG